MSINDELYKDRARALDSAVGAIETALSGDEATGQGEGEQKHVFVSKVLSFQAQKTEAELVEGFREELVEALKVQANILDRMQKAGFAGFNHSFSKNHYGNHIIASLVILKAFG